MSKPSKLGCIQLNIGGNKYYFRDVDTSSTSLKHIAETLLKKAQKGTIEEEILNKIIDYNEKDINKLSREENKSNLFSSIGDYAIGNQSAMTLGTISALKEEYNRKEIFQVLNLLKGSTDNNILLYDNPKSNRDSIVYIGHNRTFIALNASKDLNSSKILNILSFLYYDKELNNPNSNIFKVASNIVSEIRKDNSELAKEFLNLDGLSSTKKLLQIIAQNDKYKDDSRIKQAEKELSDELYKTIKLKKNNDYLKSKLSRFYSEPVTKVLSMFKKDSTIHINGLDYSNSLVVNMLKDMVNASYDETVSQEDLNKYDYPENFPIILKQFYYKQLENGGDYKTLLTELFNNIDPKKRIEFNKNTKKLDAIETIMLQIYSDFTNIIEETKEDSSNNRFIPRISDIRINPDFKYSKPKNTIINGNLGLNRQVKDNSNIIILLDTSIDKAIEDVSETKEINKTKKNSKDSVRVISKRIIKINPNKLVTVSEEDLKDYANSFKKLIGQSNRSIVYTGLNHNYNPSKSEESLIIDNLQKILDKINTITGNTASIKNMYIAPGDKFSIELIQASIQLPNANINNYIYPNYHNIYSTNDIYNRFDSTITTPDIKTTLPTSNIMGFELDDNINVESKNAKYRLLKKQKGDLIYAVDKNNPERKELLQVKEIIDFSFKPGVLRFSDNNQGVTNPSDFYNDQELTFKNGVVGNYVMDVNGESQIISATILGRDGENYIIITQNGAKASIDKSQFHPLYLSEIRTINGITYYYNSYGLYTINKKGEITLLKNTKKDTALLNGFKKFFSKELDSLNKNYNIQLNNILDYNRIRNFKYIGLSKYSPEQFRSSELKATNQNSNNMLEILASSIRRKGIRVEVGNTKELKNKTGLKESNVKAFVHEGTIYLNKDNMTADSPIHELMHLLLAQHKLLNPDKYKEMIDNPQITELNEWKELRELYSDLTDSDRREEVLVHAMTNYFMGRVADYSYMDFNLDIGTLANQLFEVNNFITDNAREDVNNFLSKSIRSLFNSNNKYLEKLKIGYDNSEIVENAKISSYKSYAKKNKLLTEDCN